MSHKHHRNVRWTTRTVYFYSAQKQLRFAALWSSFAPPFSGCRSIPVLQVHGDRPPHCEKKFAAHGFLEVLPGHFFTRTDGSGGRDFLEPPGGTVVDESAYLILVKDKGVGLNAGHGLTNILFQISKRL